MFVCHVLPRVGCVHVACGGAHQIVRVGSRRDALWERRTSVDGSASSRLGYIMPSWSRTRAGVANSVARRRAWPPRSAENISSLGTHHFACGIVRQRCDCSPRNWHAWASCAVHASSNVFRIHWELFTWSLQLSQPRVVGATRTAQQLKREPSAKSQL